MGDNWLYVEGKRDGRPYAAGIRVPLTPDRWPGFDHHVTLELGYAPHWRTGWPKPKELTRLQEFEDRLIEHLEGHGALVATETSDATRTIHLLLRGGGLVDMYRDRERLNDKPGISVTVVHDPQWVTLARLSAIVARAAA